MRIFIAKMGAVLLASVAALIFTACGEDSGTNSVAVEKMVDPRDGQDYKTVQIGGKIWMAENLNYQTGGSKCPGDIPENCDKYGRLYVWGEAIVACPEGWYLPSVQELEDLRALAGRKAGDFDKAGTVLKSTTGWKESDGKSGNGTNGLGFGALPIGGSHAFFWSSTGVESSFAFYLWLVAPSEDASLVKNDRSLYVSVRCVKN